MANTDAGGSVLHALRALELLADRPSVGVSELAAELGVAPSSAHRLLGTLRAHGYAVQDAKRRYLRGPSFARLGGERAGDETLRRLLHPHLLALSRRIDETAHSVVIDRSDRTMVRFLDSVESHQALRVTTRAGRRLPAHCTSGGKALLAALDPDTLAQRYPAGLPPAPPPALRDLAALRRELAQVRRRGYAVNREESEPGIVAVGGCVRDASGRPVAALSVSVPAVRLTRRDLPRIAQAVLGAAREASGEL